MKRLVCAVGCLILALAVLVAQANKVSAQVRAVISPFVGNWQTGWTNDITGPAAQNLSGKTGWQTSPMVIRSTGVNQITGFYTVTIVTRDKNNQPQTSVYTSCFNATVSADGTVADGKFYQAQHGSGILTFKITGGRASNNQPTFAGIYSWTKPNPGAPTDEDLGYSGYWAGARQTSELTPRINPDQDCLNRLQNN